MELKLETIITSQDRHYQLLIVPYGIETRKWQFLNIGKTYF